MVRQQNIIRGKHGRFTFNPLAEKHIGTITIGVLTVCFLIVSLLLILTTVKLKEVGNIISPIPCYNEVDIQRAINSGGLIISE